MKQYNKSNIPEQLKELTKNVDSGLEGGEFSILFLPNGYHGKQYHGGTYDIRKEDWEQDALSSTSGWSVGIFVVVGDYAYEYEDLIHTLRFTPRKGVGRGLKGGIIVTELIADWKQDCERSAKLLGRGEFLPLTRDGSIGIEVNDDFSVTWKGL